MYKCPNACGSKEFVQSFEQTETVHLNEHGDPVHFEQHEQGPITFVECAECGTTIDTESLDVYVVVVHPADTASDVVNVYTNEKRAEQVADELRSEEQSIEAAVKQYEVDV
jgi:hypothetical protein